MFSAITFIISEGIVKTMQKEAGPSSKELQEVKDFEDFIARKGGCVVGKVYWHFLNYFIS